MISSDETFIKFILLTFYVLFVTPGFVICLLIVIEFFYKLLTKEIVIEKEDE